MDVELWALSLIMVMENNLQEKRQVNGPQKSSPLLRSG